MPLNAGDLDTQITLQQRAAGIDERGKPNGAWASIATDPTPWAKQMPSKGREFFAAGQVQGESYTMWRVRYRTDLYSATMRALEGSTAWDIIDIVPGPGREWLDLYCVSGVRDGR